MSITNTWGVSWSGGGGNSVSKTKDISSDTGIVAEFVVPAGTTNQQQQFGFDAADIEGVLITVEGDGTDDPDGAVVLKTNDTGSPGHTITWPAAGGELFWTSRSPVANPFGTTDVTTTYWTNPGTVAVTVKVRLQMNT